MEEMTNIIKDLSIEEREEIFVDIARTLEDTAREALVEGNMQFAEISNNMDEVGVRDRAHRMPGPRTG